MKTSINSIFGTGVQKLGIARVDFKGMAHRALIATVAATALVGSVVPAAQAQGRWDQGNGRWSDNRDRRDNRDRDNRNHDDRDRRDNRDRDNRNHDDRDRRDNRDDRNHDDRRDNWRDRINDQNSHRQDTKNNWRNLAILGGGATVLGILKHDSTITFVGALGGLYSLNRYEQDRRSQSDADRARARFFEQGAFDRDGHHYERREVVRNGQRYWQFARR